jgi:hypothetical protein
MKVKQISVFLENKNGRLAEVTKVLSAAGINLRAATIADTADFGILRLICDKPDKAVDVLKKAGFTARVTDVIGIKLSDQPGTLAHILEVLEKNKVNIEYLYSTIMQDGGKVVVVFRVENIDESLKIIHREKLETIAAF